MPTRAFIAVLFALWGIFLSSPVLAQGDEEGTVFAPVSTPADNLVLTLTYKRTPIGFVQGFSYSGGLYVSVEDLLKLLEFKTTNEPEQGRIYGHYWDERWFVLSTGKHKLIIDQQMYDIDSQQVVATETGVFADVTLLSRYFPFDLSTDLSNLTLSISPNEAIPKLQKILADIPGEKPPEVAPKVAIPPPIPDDQTQMSSWMGGLKESPQEPVAIEREQVPAITETAEEKTTPPPLPSSIAIEDENFLVLELQVGEFAYDDLLDIYAYEGHYYVPMSQLALAVQMALDIDPEAGAISGWYFDEDNTFSLDLTSRKVINRGKESAIEPTAAFVADDDIFVTTTLISQWFPVDASVDFNNQLFVLNPRILLPFQAKKERELLREKWLRTSGEDKEYEIVTPEYGFDWPISDVTLNNDYQKPETGESSFNTNYFALLNGDIGLLGLEGFVSGNDEEISSLRIKGRRTDINGDLLGVLTELELGDINSIDSELVANTEIGRGLLVSNFPLGRASQFDSTTITGDALPGWEVELYINSTLFAFQIVGDDGRYDFRDVPIFYGNNTVKLVFYGPQGEVREEIQQFAINDAIVQQGDFHYRLSASQIGATITEIGGGMEDEKGRQRYIGEVEYGLLDNLTLFYGTTFTEFESDDEHTYQSLGFATNLGPVTARVNSAYDIQDDSWALRFSGNTRLFGMNIQAQHEQFENFVSAVNETTNDKTEMESRLNLSGNISLPKVSGLGYFLNTSHERFESGRKQTEFTNRLSTSFAGLNYTNRAELNLNTPPVGETTTSADGTFSIRGSVFRTSVRADLDYDLDPETAFRSAGLSLQKRLTNKLNSRLDIDKDFMGSRSVRLSGLINWDQGDFTLGTGFNANTEGSFAVNTNLSFSLYQEPRSRDWQLSSKKIASSGSVSARAFLDENYNGVLDENEEILQNVVFKRSNAAFSTNGEGIAFIDSVPTDIKTNITIDEASLEDSFWYPAKEGYTLIARAGATAKLDFPVIETSEIEGELYLILGDREKPVAGVRLYLLTPDGQRVAETKSEYDGYYVFTQVQPGEYVVTVSDEDAQILRVVATNKPEVTIVEGPGDVYYDNNILLKKIKNLPKDELIKRYQSDVESGEEIASPIADNVVECRNMDIGVYPSAQEASDVWQTFQTRYPALLGQLEYSVQEISLNQQTLYHINVGPFKSKKEALQVCEALSDGAAREPMEKNEN